MSQTVLGGKGHGKELWFSVFKATGDLYRWIVQSDPKNNFMKIILAILCEWIWGGQKWRQKDQLGGYWQRLVKRWQNVSNGFWKMYAHLWYILE